LRASPGAGEVPPKSKVPYLYSKGDISANTTLETGDYVIRAEVYGDQLGDESVQGAIKLNGTELKKFETRATASGAATTIEAKQFIKAGQQRLSVAFFNPAKDPKDDKKKASTLRPQHLGRWAVQPAAADLAGRSPQNHDA